MYRLSDYANFHLAQLMLPLRGRTLQAQNFGRANE